MQTLAYVREAVRSRPQCAARPLLMRLPRWRGDGLCAVLVLENTHPYRPFNSALLGGCRSF
ncbi:Uncharacterised protein [Rothia dentocariosa]|nr:Uncharacterised protein [Rothia dentocariosa]